MSQRVVSALHRGLASLFYVAERILHTLQKKADFNPDEAGPLTVFFFQLNFRPFFLEHNEGIPSHSSTMLEFS